MQHFWKKKLILCGIFIAASVICEIVTFLIMRIGFLPEYFLLDFSVLLFIAGIIFVIPNNVVSIVLSSVVLFLQAALSFVNINLYSMHGDIFTLDLLSLSGEAGGVLGFVNWWYSLVYFAIFALALTAMIVVSKKVKSDKFSFKRYNIVMLAFIFIVFSVLTPVAGVIQAKTLPNDSEKTIFGVSTKENFNELTFKINFFKKFGTFALFYRNVITNTRPGNLFLAPSFEETLEYLNTSELFKSEYFGVDKSNNVLVVMTESFDSIFVSEKYTPNMFRLLNEGVAFNGYYANAKTDVSEASVILGNYPEQGNLVAPSALGGGSNSDMRNSMFASEFPFSLPNLFKNKGYESNYFLAHNGHYYSRQYTHPSYGFDGVFFNESYPKNDDYDDYEEYIDSWCMPEEYFMDSAIKAGDFLPTDRPFYSHLGFINPHGAYGISAQLCATSEYYYDEVIDDNDFDYLSKSVYKIYKTALAKAMVADDGIGYLIEQLETRKVSPERKAVYEAETGRTLSEDATLADITTMLFFSDHNAYANNLAYNYRGTTKGMSPSYHLPAAIWSPSLNNTGLKIDKFVNTFDLVPTLLDILGIEINPNMYLGVNAFDDSQTSIVYSKLGVIFNDKICTDGMYITYTAPEVTDEDLENFRQDYFWFINKWKHINNLFLKGNEIFFN